MSDGLLIWNVKYLINRHMVQLHGGKGTNDFITYRDDNK